MEHIGYSLIDSIGNEVWHIGDTKGQVYTLPEAIRLPNGDTVHCAQVGDTLSDWRLVERWINDVSTSRWYSPVDRTVSFDGTKVIVTVNYETTPSIVPQTITPRQARLALLGANLLDQVEAAVTAAGGATKITWDYATEVNRNDPLIMSISSSLGMSSSQVDELFRTAYEI